MPCCRLSTETSCPGTPTPRGFANVILAHCADANIFVLFLKNVVSLIKWIGPPTRGGSFASQLFFTWWNTGSFLPPGDCLPCSLFSLLVFSPLCEILSPSHALYMEGADYLRLKERKGCSDVGPRALWVTVDLIHTFWFMRFDRVPEGSSNRDSCPSPNNPYSSDKNPTFPKSWGLIVKMKMDKQWPHELNAWTRALAARMRHMLYSRRTNRNHEKKSLITRQHLWLGFPMFSPHSKQGRFFHLNECPLKPRVSHKISFVIQTLRIIADLTSMPYLILQLTKS